MLFPKFNSTRTNLIPSVARSVLADERTGGMLAVSSIGRTRRTPSSISWTCSVKYLPDFHSGRARQKL